MRPRRIRKILSPALGLIILGAVWFYLAPTQLGGSATYVVTHGTSMEPRFHTGDLAVVRSQSSYHVGEVVAYHSHKLHTIVLHRIIGRAGDRYIFKGDHNDFVDPEHPLAGQLIGALWIHIPGAGVRLQSIRSPAVMAGLIFLGILLFTGGAFTRRQGRRRRQQRMGASIAPPSSHLPQHEGNPVVGLLAIGLLALLPFVVLALLAYTRPVTTRNPINVPYKQGGMLSYSADTAGGPAYPSGRAVTGEPLFTNVLRAVEVRFGYRFETAAKHALAGRASLAATVSAANGWHATLPLAAPRYFRGDRALVAGTLDLGSLLALIHSVEAETKVLHGAYTLTIAPRVQASGSVEHAPLQTTFAPEVKFSILEGELKPEAESTGAEASPGAGSSKMSQFDPSESGSVTGGVVEPGTLSLGFAQPSVATARVLARDAIVLILCAVLALLALRRPLLALRGAQPQDESATIQSRYGRMIVPVERVWQLPGVPVIDVADMEALAQIAEHYDRSILHETAQEGEAFWVTDESGQFRYAIGAWVSAVDGEPIDQFADQFAGDTRVHEVYADEFELDGTIAAYEPQPAQETFAPGADGTFVPEADGTFVPEADETFAPEAVVQGEWTPRRDGGRGRAGKPGLV
jgi:signal peptidase I